MGKERNSQQAADLIISRKERSAWPPIYIESKHGDRYELIEEKKREGEERTGQETSNVTYK
jgi:hypothetical protein